MAGKNDKLREWAAHLFIVEGYTQKAISEYIDVSENTIGKWKKDYGWEEERLAILASPRKVKSVLLTEFEKISKGEISKIDADALSKVHKVIMQMNATISPEIIHAVLKLLDTWMSETNPALAVQNLPYHRKFLLHQIQIDG